MTLSDLDLDAERSRIGSEFAKRLTDAGFRAHLRGIGWQPGQHIVPALDDEPATRVVARMLINGSPSPALIVIHASSEQFGFRLMFAEVSITKGRMPKGRMPWHRRRPPPIPPAASIGMIYSSLQPCGEFVPNDWSPRIVFERVVT